MFKTQRAKKNDLLAIAKINLICFHGSKDLKESKKWVWCNFSAFPRFQYFVIKEKNKILGYILWYFKGGWRQQSVLELEQIAIHPAYQSKGAGSQLVKESLEKIKKHLEKDSRKLKAIIITTSTGQKARKIYEKVLQAKKGATIKKLFSGDEIILIKRFK